MRLFSRAKGEGGEPHFRNNPHGQKEGFTVGKTQQPEEKKGTITTIAPGETRKPGPLRDH